MLDDVKAYYEALDKAEEIRQAADHESQLARRRKGGSATVRHVEAAIISNRFETAKAEARLALLHSSDPLVAFIADRPLREYPDHAKAILQALPASQADLEAISSRQGWCGEWSKFVNMAEDAGVLPGQVRLSPERVELRDWFRTTITSSREYRDKLMAYVDDIVAAELAAAGVKPEDTPAEPEQDTKE